VNTKSRSSGKESTGHPSSPSSSRSSLLSAMASARTTVSLLYDLGCEFATRVEIDQLIPFVVDKCREVLDAEGVSVLLLDREHNELYFPYISGEDPKVAERLARVRFSAELGIAASALKRCETLRIEDAQSDARFYHGIDQLTGVTTRNLLAAPLRSHQGMTGVVEVVNKHGAPAFSDDDASFIEALSSSIAIAIENARLYGEVRESEARLRTQVGALRRDLARRDGFAEIVGTGPAMSEVRQLMETAALSSITVLIQGETGTGKELVARGLHRASSRADRPFLALNCAAMPEALLESELFGHRRGAFTGAIRDNLGLFRAAAGGVVFLDEIADMPIGMQAKLLRVLEEEEVVPLGDNFPRKVDVRVLSATNRDLKTEVAGGRFREDLYYRLAVFPISVPPLRQRREDIPLLAVRFLTAAAEQQHKSVTGLDPEAMDMLSAYAWPGNVRELRNEIERAVALTGDGKAVSPEQLSAAVRAQTASATASDRVSAGFNRHDRTSSGGRVGEESTTALRGARAAFEADYITKMLKRHQGNVSRAARALGLSRSSVQKKMKEYGLR
jgi:transcriptional regulator with GAF, ATPase, and Fis domain